VRRTLLTLCALAVCGLTLWAQASKDSPAAAATRKKLQAKVSVDFKDAKMSEIAKELKDKVKDATGQELSIVLDNVGGVSNNLTVPKYQAKDKTVAEILDEMFKPLDMGYIVISKEYKNYKGRYDGWVLFVKGKERGYAEGIEPKETPAKDKAKTSDKDKVAKDKAKTDDKDKAKTQEKDKATAEDKDKGGGEDKMEAQAASALKLSKDRIKLGLKAKAKESLQDLIKHYPKTKAAEEARELVKTLK
jgi:hypothetical protein